MAFYKNYLILVLGLLALATNVLAANIKFTAKYNEGIGGQPSSTGKNIEKPDDEASAILQNIGQWSHGRYKAAISESKYAKKEIINVELVTPVQNKGQASDEVQNMIQMSNQHTRESDCS